MLRLLIFNKLNNIYHDIYFSKNQEDRDRSEEDVNWEELEQTLLKEKITKVI